MHYYLRKEQATADGIDLLDCLFLTDDGVRAINNHNELCKIEDYYYSEVHQCFRMLLQFRGGLMSLPIQAVVDVRIVKEETAQAQRLLRLCGYAWFPCFWKKENYPVIKVIGTLLCHTVQTG